MKEILFSSHNIFLALLTSFIVTFISIPSIIKIAKLKGLFDSESDRGSHYGNIPTLGGVAIFAGLIFSLSFWIRPEDFFQMKFVLAAIILLFFMGIKDDLVNLVAVKKLVIQLTAAFIIAYFGDIRITSLYGLLGIYDIHYIFSIILTIVAITGIVNSFNLIDGVNGLAGSIGAFVCIILGGWFYLSGINSMAVLSFSCLGALFGFLWYNKTPAKIFMGDTGSLLLGAVCAILSLRFIEINKNFSGPLHITSVPAVAIAILIVPLFDVLRVFVIRLYSGYSPFDADRNHLHHRLLDLGFSHHGCTTVLLSFNMLITFIAFSLRETRGEYLFLLILLLTMIFSLAIELMAKKRRGQSMHHIGGISK